MRHQPVPEVTRADVERVVCRDFPEAMFVEVLSLLDEYDATSGPPSARVQLAVLKLADGDMRALKRSVRDARMDYRDVLAWAEYPQYMRRVPGPGQPADVDEVIHADWTQ